MIKKIINLINTNTCIWFLRIIRKPKKLQLVDSSFRLFDMRVSLTACYKYKINTKFTKISYYAKKALYNFESREIVVRSLLK